MDLTQTPAGAATSPIRPNWQMPLQNLRVFLAEDDPDTRWLIALMNLGARALLHKPVDFAELRRALVALATDIARPRARGGAAHPGESDCGALACSACGATEELAPYGADSFCRDCVRQADRLFGGVDYCELGGEG
jgi:hypothetical protein